MPTAGDTREIADYALHTSPAQQALAALISASSGSLHQRLRSSGVFTFTPAKSLDGSGFVGAVGSTKCHGRRFRFLMSARDIIGPLPERAGFA